MSALKLKVEVRGENLVIEVPFRPLAAIVEADEFTPAKITDQTVFAQYLARYLEGLPGDHDLAVLLERAVLHVCEDAIFMGAGILRSRLEDTPHLIDQMWDNHGTVRMSDANGKPEILTTTHRCLIEAMRAAREGKLDVAAEWLDFGQDCNETISEILQEDVEGAMTYALAAYGSKMIEEEQAEKGSETV